MEFNAGSRVQSFEHHFQVCSQTYIFNEVLYYCIIVKPARVFKGAFSLPAGVITVAGRLVSIFVSVGQACFREPSGQAPCSTSLRFACVMVKTELHTACVADKTLYIADVGSAGADASRSLDRTHQWLKETTDPALSIIDDYAGTTVVAESASSPGS